jgi:hypothetical protein
MVSLVRAETIATTTYHYRGREEKKIKESLTKKNSVRRREWC